MKLSNILEARKPPKPRPLKVFIANHFEQPPEETKLRFGKRTYAPTRQKGQYYSADIIVPTEVLQEINAIIEKNPTLVFTPTKSGGIEFNIWEGEDEDVANLLSAASKQRLAQLAQQSIKDNFPSSISPRRDTNETLIHIVGDILRSRKAQLRNLVRSQFTEQVGRGKIYAQLKRRVNAIGDDNKVTAAQLKKALDIIS